ncbi:hypothetical protein EGW08_002969, partial [Elysia chlorotica]
MDVCRCCKSAHKNLSFSNLDLSGDGDDEYLLSDAIIEELGETSLSWFEDLSESSVSGNSSSQKGENVSLSESERNWSPCPRGGLAAIRIKGNMASETTQLCPFKITSELSKNNRSSSCGELCTSTADLSWTSAMATPLDAAGSFSDLSRSALSPGGSQASFHSLEKTETSSPLTPVSSEKKQQSSRPKVLNRMLFSPGQRTWSNDSLSKIGEWSLIGNVTGEHEETICSESDTVAGNSLDMISACNETLRDEQETLTVHNSSAVLSCDTSIKWENAMSPCPRLESEAHLETITTVHDCVDCKDANVGAESEFSDSFTAEEMAMVEDDCLKQTESNVSPTDSLLKKDSVLPLTTKVSPAVKAGSEKDKNTFIYSSKHHVESVLSLIFSQSKDSPSHPEGIDGKHPDLNHNEKSKNELELCKAEEDINISVGPSNCNGEHKEVSSPTQERCIDSHLMFGNESAKVNNRSTPQSILKHMQTPRSSIKKRVRFSICSRSSSLSQLAQGKTTATDPILAKDCASEGVGAVISTDVAFVFPNKTGPQCSENVVTSNSDVSEQLHRPAQEALPPHHSPSQCVLVSSQIEDISTLYSQNDNCESFPEIVDEQLSQNCENNNENDLDLHCGTEHFKDTTPMKNEDFQNNCSTNGFVFDDLSPSLSPSFPSQILSMSEGLEEHKKADIEGNLGIDKVLTNGSNTDRSKISKTILESLSDSVTESIDNLKGCDEMSKSIEIHSKVKSKVVVDENYDVQKSFTNTCMLEDEDDDIMCAAALSAESHSELTHPIPEPLTTPATNQILELDGHQVSSDISKGKQTSASTLTATASLSADKSVIPDHPYLVHITESSTSNPVCNTIDAKPVISLPCLIGSRNSPISSNAMTVISVALPSQEEKVKDLNTVTPFSTPKRSKFVYPAPVQKQSAAKNGRDNNLSTISTKVKQQTFNAKALSSTETSSPDYGKHAELNVNLSKLGSNPGKLESGECDVSNAANITRNKILVATDFLMKKATQTTDTSRSNHSNKLPLCPRVSDGHKDEVKELRLNKGSKSRQSFLGFAKFSDIFEDSEGPLALESMDDAADLGENRESIIDEKSTSIEFQGQKASSVEKTECEDNQGNHESNVVCFVDSFIDTGIKDRSENKGKHLEGTTKGPAGCGADEVLIELEEDFTSQMWTATEFSQMELDSGDNENTEQTVKPTMIGSSLGSLSNKKDE